MCRKILRGLITVSLFAVMALYSPKIYAMECEAGKAEFRRLMTASKQLKSEYSATTAQITQKGTEIKRIGPQYNEARRLNDGALARQLEREIDRLWAARNEDWRRRYHLIKASRDNWRQSCDILRKLNRPGCLPDANVDKCFAAMDGLNAKVAQASTRNKKLRKDWRKKGEKAKPRKRNPTVTVINKSSISICWHLGGLSGGGCGIKPGDKKVFRLKNLKAREGSRSFDTNQIVMVGGGRWAGSPWTKYDGMKLCAQRNFTHDDGNVEWQVFNGIASGCQVRGYSQ